MREKEIYSSSRWSRCCRWLRYPLAACAFLMLFQAASADEALDRRFNFAIAENTPLEDALIEWGTKVGVTVMVNTKTVDWKVTHKISGVLSARDALSQLLHGSGLSFTEDGGRIRIVPRDALVRSGLQLDELGATSSVRSDYARDVVNSGATEENANATARQSDLAQVVVTAQKREERLQDVPVPVTALSSESLVSANQLTVSDYYSSVPGLNLVGLGGVAIRGITTAGGFATATVGSTVDDVPYGPSTGLAGFDGTVPDLDPSDLARIEVLRGPQGTLYGASSIGGLLKYITANPSTDALSGRVEADISNVKNGPNVGYGVRAAANVPVSDTIAFRVSGVTRRDPGFIDNPALGVDGINSRKIYGGRISVMWKPSDSYSLRFGVLSQKTVSNGASSVNVDVGSGKLIQSFLPGTGQSDRRVTLYTANFEAQWGGINLVSVTGYGVYKTQAFSDFTSFYGGSGNLSDTFFGAAGAGDVDSLETKKFTQEVRLTGAVGKSLDWLAGVYYTHEGSDPINQQVYAANASTGLPVGVLYNAYYPTTFAELAGFADLTVHFTERFDVQFGGRQSGNRQVYNETDSGPITPLYFGVGPAVIPTEHTSGSAFTYLVTPRFRISPDQMIYARIASGYRPGGPNPQASFFHYPTEFAADKTTNYEIGYKGDALNRTLSFDASIYYIDWRDIQVSVIDPVSFFTYFTNASGAKSEGLEVSTELRPTSGTQIAAWVAWNEAILTAPLNGTAVGNPGDRLPFSSRWSGTLTVDQEFPLGLTPARGFVGASAMYVGDREGVFSGNFSQTRAILPSYIRLDLRAGVRHESWNVSVFVKNAMDRRAVLDASYIGTTPYIAYLQPRTVGLSVVKTF